MTLSNYFTLALKYIALVTPIVALVLFLLTVAFYTVAERKIMGSVQRRQGPNVVGVFGLLQAFADALKLVLKEPIIPTKANTVLFIVAPALTLTCALLQWALFIPTSNLPAIKGVPATLMGLLAVSSLSIYGVILAGWSSNSRYAFLGALRSTSQMVAYEVLIGLMLAPLLAITSSFSLVDIGYVQSQLGCWFIVPFLPLFAVYLIAMLAETNRAPFDLPEAEAELVAGYNVEYGALHFTMFFLGEYTNTLTMAALGAQLFLGGWTVVKFLLLAVFFVVIRATLPRYRYDQLLAVGWQGLLPVVLSFFAFFICWLILQLHV